MQFPSEFEHRSVRSNPFAKTAGMDAFQKKYPPFKKKGLHFFMF